MFKKTGSIFTLSDVSRIKKADSWENYIASQEKKSVAEGVIVHRPKTSDNLQKVVCNIDLDKYIYIHTTIMASVDIDPGTEYFITKDTEKYINNNGDAWPREQLLKDYSSFVEYGTVYVEHDQNPERAKGKVLDAIARDMGDTILIDLLFCVDRRHADLVNNIETGIANAVSMGCSTKYTVCCICGNMARDESEYCKHIKNKNVMYPCADGKMRRAAELCYDNAFFDCSIVANPAFAGAIFRKLVASDQVSNQLLANIITKKVSSFDDELIKVASQIKEAVHPIEHEKMPDYPVENMFSDIPYKDRYNVLPEFEKQQPKNFTVTDADKKKKANIDRGALVILSKRYDIPPNNRKASNLFNFVAEDTVGRIIGQKNGAFTVYFSKLGTIKDIPASILRPYSMSEDIAKEASIKTATDEDLVVRRKGMFKPTGERFQIVDVADDEIEVRWLSGDNAGEKEKLPKKEFKKKRIKWASINDLAMFDAIWTGKSYQLKSANWNEKCANILNKYENHIDNIQHDVISVVPMTKGKYARSFKLNSRIDDTLLQFKTAINGNNLQIKVKSTEW